MSIDSDRARSRIAALFQEQSIDDLERRLEPRTDALPPHVPKASETTPDVVDRRWKLLDESGRVREALLDEQSASQMQAYERNVENFIGTVKVPIGLAGPIRVNGFFAQGDYYVPLATTEAALVASYSRGAQIISEAGGCSAMLLNEGVGRAPGFAFRSLREAGRFVSWAAPQVERFREIAESTTSHGKLVDMKITIEGSNVYLNFEMTTGDAAGQNMVTFATQAIGEYIERECPVKPKYSFVEANLSGDKKASAQSFQTVRGRKVSADLTLPAELVEERLHTTPERIANYWRMSVVGGVLSGTIGHQGHYANGLAALYIACGQDAACVSESAIGITRFETTSEGDLYASVTLPNVIVGTVGGGTSLPSQRACLEILGLAGPGNARAFAELCAGLALAGEISIIGALCAGEFVQAHRSLARGS